MTPQPTPSPIQEAGPNLDAAYDASSLEPRPCPEEIADPAISCAIATLPLHHDRVSAGTVELFVASVDNGDPLGAGPVIFLQGGPGIGGTARARQFVGAEHDAVFFDPRGTGRSVPKLDCPGVDALWPREHIDGPDRVGFDAMLDAYVGCADDLRGDGIDLDAFHTDASANDVELLRRLLGHERWSLWGISYGTRLAQAVMRAHPDHLHAVALDAVLPFEADFFATIPRNALDSIDALDAACAVDECSRDHGDFGDNLEALVARLSDDPVTVDVSRPVSGAALRYVVTGTDLLEIVFSQLYSTRELRSLPRQIARPDNGGLLELVARRVWRSDPERLDLAEGVYYATWCREEHPFHDAAADDDTIEQGVARFGPAFADALGTEGIDRLCEAFDVAPADAESDQPLTPSGVSVIVFAGTFDPVTPAQWSATLADRLDAVYVEFSDHGHGMTSPCAASLRVRFLAAPADPLDVSCVDSFGLPEFD